MSEFLPEKLSGAPAMPAAPQFVDAVALDSDTKLMQRVLNAAAANPSLIPPQFMAYMVDYVQTSKLTLPIGQITGFTQFNAVYQSVAASATFSATAYGDASDGPNPVISGLSDGSYAAFFSCQFFEAAPGGEYVHIGVKYNSTEADDDNGTTNVGATNVNIDLIGFSAFTVKGGNPNTVTLRYRVENRSGSPVIHVYDRKLMVIKYANQ